MDQDRALRGIAGFFVIISVALSYYHSPWWLLFTLFVGLNQLQSAFTNWCLMMNILSACGVEKKDAQPQGGDAS